MRECAAPIGFEPLGQPGLMAICDRWYCRDKRAPQNTLEMEKPAERSQRRDGQLRDTGIHRGTPGHHEGGDIRRGQAGKIEIAFSRLSIKERTQAIDISKDRRSCQPAVYCQEPPIPIQDFTSWAVFNGVFGGWYQPQPTQIDQNGTQCFARLQLADTGSTAVSHEPVYFGHRQIGHRELLALQPNEEVIE